MQQARYVRNGNVNADKLLSKMKFFGLFNLIFCTKYLLTVKDGLDESVAMNKIEEQIAKVGGVVLNK